MGYFLQKRNIFYKIVINHESLKIIKVGGGLVISGTQ